MRCVQYVLQLGVLARVLGFGYSEKSFLDRSPIGPKMCEEACSYTVGCTSHWFSALKLKCFLSSDNFDKDKNKRTLDAESTWVKSDFMGCPKGSQIIFTRTKEFKCLYYSPVPLIPTRQSEDPASTSIATTSTTGATTTYSTTAVATTVTNSKIGAKATTSPAAKKKTLEEYHIRTSILFLRRGDHNIYQLNLQNAPLHTYLRDPNYPIAFAYMSELRQIVIGVLTVSKRRKLISYLTHDLHPQVIKSNLKDFYSIAVDGNCRLIFLSLMRGNILKISLNHYVADKILKGPRNHFNNRNLVIFPRYKTLYVSCQQGIFSVSYDGQDKSVWIAKQRFPELTIDPTHSVLYYCIKKVLYTMCLQTVRSTLMLKLEDTPLRIEYHRKRVYVTIVHDKTIQIGFIDNSSSFSSIGTYTMKRNVDDLFGFYLYSPKAENVGKN